MKLIYLILGILLTLTSESYSKDTDSVVIPGQFTSPSWIEDTGSPKTTTPEKATPPPVRNNILITSDHMTHDKKRDMIWAWGKVIIRFPDKTLQADNIKVNNKTGDGKAVGNVIITQSDGTRLKSQKSLFNMNNKHVRLFESRGKLGKQHYIKGKVITRYSENHFKIKKGHLTTCAGSLPDWTFESESTDILVQDRALFTNGVFKVRGIPVFYLPVAYIPIGTERKSGFLKPSYGHSSTEGIAFNSTYFWAINGHSDATFTLGYQSKVGYNPGIDYRYTPSKTTKGSIVASYINNKLTRTRLWKANAVHKQELSNKFNLDLTLDLERGFGRNFSDDSYKRTRRKTDS
ncbi:MAG: putative LPS assembly protein LptD, partial [Nitrospinaceae bacterium]